MRYENEPSEEITIKRGVRRGTILSPCLFNIYTEYLITEALEDGKGININGQNTSNIRYADNTIILAESEQHLQYYMIDNLDATCEQYGMAMNAKKTKTMIVEKTPEKQCEVNVKGQRLTQVKQYKYLGTTVENIGQYMTEVANKINQAKIAFCQLQIICWTKEMCNLARSANRLYFHLTMEFQHRLAQLQDGDRSTITCSK